MEKEIFDDFFKPYAENVDNADQASAFWRFSDALILEIITREILTHCNDRSVVMDAGGGTGRWVVKMAAASKAQFKIYDRSSDMLTNAKSNVTKAGIDDRVELIEGDLVEMSQVANDSIDHIVSIYSPISFVYQPKKAFQELYRVLKPGGKILMMGHGYYNALASKMNNYRAAAEEIEILFEQAKVKWAPHVPTLITYSQESMNKAFAHAGFQPVKTYGVPVLVQPGAEDFSATNEGESAVSKYLSDEKIFNQIFDIEMQINAHPEVANRGMNIFGLAKK